MVKNMQNTTITLLLSEEQITNMISFYSDNVVENKNEYVNKQFKLEKVTITIYTSNKVVFQGENATYEASIWDNSLLTNSTNEININDKLNNEWKYKKNHLGSDEVGTGDYFGPLCVCAAYVKEEDIPYLESLKINDSKKLSDDHIRKIAPSLLKHISYSQISVDPIKYNALIKQGYNQAKIKAILHNQVIHNLREKTTRAALTIMDQFINEARYYEYVKFSPYIEGQIRFETKAESKYPAVAVASIIARYSFLTKMEALSNTLGKKVPKGAGKEVDEFAKELVKEYGKEKLSELAKIHFANTQKIEE